MTHFLSPERVEAMVVAVAQPLLDSLVARNMTGGREAVHIVVIDPDSAWDDPLILFEMTLGEIPDGKAYVDIANQKAVQAWREQCDTRELVRMSPHLLQDGDVLFAGGVYRHGLACGVSGLPSAWDEVIAVAVIEACRALCFVNSEAVIADSNAPLFLPA